MTLTLGFGCRLFSQKPVVFGKCLEFVALSNLANSIPSHHRSTSPVRSRIAPPFPDPPRDASIVRPEVRNDALSPTLTPQSSSIILPPRADKRSCGLSIPILGNIRILYVRTMSYQYGFQLIYNTSQSISEPRFCFVDLPCGKTPHAFSTALTPAHRHRRGERRLCHAACAGVCIWITGSAPLTCLGKDIKPTLAGEGDLWLRAAQKMRNTPTLGPPILPVPSGVCERGNLERSVHHRRPFPLHPERMGRPVNRTLKI